MTSVTLNVKISSELKEKIRLYAEEKQETLGSVTEELLTKALKIILEEDSAIEESEVDNQHTEEKRVPPLSDNEIKALRKLLKKKK
ncbi:hypothetical protein [Citrobacter sp. JGM124]|uniref:hypothetical protein n=1 Tax=Citrobacter sp. JGM124 TaxID=2799789 RepID=UPI001BA88978|nr:hypothetical protein [Citrobacter sp. JGM124]MBS0848698.1 hypothetical protein [Citrobacter sp. JGM124]